jgi:5-methyltetrahydrofolate--homocysteine methyltransferase
MMSAHLYSYIILYKFSDAVGICFCNCKANSYTTYVFNLRVLRMSEELFNSIKEDLMRGKVNEVIQLCEQAVVCIVPVEKILSEGLIAARAMNAGMSVLKPLLQEADIKKAKGIICVGTVKRDLHDIGKNLVCMMFEGAGYEVIDLGVNVDPEKFVEAARENNSDIIAMSALLTTTMGSMQATVDLLKPAGLSSKTMVGGAPLTDSFAKEIGAGGYAADAASAVDIANEMIVSLSNDKKH